MGDVVRRCVEENDLRQYLGSGEGAVTGFGGDASEA